MMADRNMLLKMLVEHNIGQKIELCSAVLSEFFVAGSPSVPEQDEYAGGDQDEENGNDIE